MDKKNHMLMDFMLFGREHGEVHDWIDSGYEKQPGYFHWLERHHLQAINAQYKNGSEEWLSAFMHIMSDWVSHWRITVVPINRQDVIANLRYIGYIQEGDFVE